MRRFVCCVIFVVLIFMCVVTGYAADKAMVSLSAQPQKINRLFDVFVDIDTDKTVCGGVVIIEYDPDMVQFKGAKSDTFDVDVKDEKGCISVAYATSVSVSNSKEVLVLNFKGINVGTSHIDVKSVELVDENLKEVANKSTGLVLDIGANSVTVRAGADTSKNIKTDKSSIQSLDDKKESSADSIKLDNGKESGIKAELIFAVVSACAIIFMVVVLLIKKEKLPEDEVN